MWFGGEELSVHAARRPFRLPISPKQANGIPTRFPISSFQARGALGGG
jgi:hypothetical protein